MKMCKKDDENQQRKSKRVYENSKVKFHYHCGVCGVQVLSNNAKETTEALNGVLLTIFEKPPHCIGDNRFMQNFCIEKFPDEDYVPNSTASGFLGCFIVQAGAPIHPHYKLIVAALNEECAKVEDVTRLACFMYLNL